MQDAPLDPRLRSNPFATKYTRPGSHSFLFPPGQSLQTIIDALRNSSWNGQIVGPHGSGKSSLVAALLPELAKEGRNVAHFVLSQGERRLPIRTADARQWTNQTQVVVDGFEQLSWWSRQKLHLLCRRSGGGLLVTVHEPRGLPTVFQTAPSLELAQSIVQELLPDADQTITAEDVAHAYQQDPANLREMLFRLYDLYQSRHH
jgi:hypothetical protein